MASNINFNDIDPAFPVAGVDNESQGFRDNFSTIRNSFVAAKDEIEALQNTTAKLNADNDFSGNEIVDAELNQVTQKFRTNVNVSSSQNISFAFGHYQVFTITGNGVTFTLSDWPDAGRYGAIRVQIYSDGTNRTIDFAVEGGGDIYYDGDFPSPFTTGTVTASPKIIEFWSFDNGDTVYAKYLGEFTTA